MLVLQLLEQIFGDVFENFDFLAAETNVSGFQAACGVLIQVVTGGKPSAEAESELPGWERDLWKFCSAGNR